LASNLDRKLQGFIEENPQKLMRYVRVVYWKRTFVDPFRTLKILRQLSGKKININNLPFKMDLSISKDQ